MNEKNFRLWLTILTPSVANIIVAGLVKKGFTVSAMFKNNVLTTGGDDSLSHVLGLFLTDSNAAATSATVRKSVFDVLTAENLKCYSAIVCDDDGGSSTSAGNLSRSDLKAAKPTLAVVKPLPVGPYRKDDGIIDDKKSDTDEERKP